MATIYLSWHKCYNEGWGQEIVPEAYSHPAKFSRGLIRRIYTHALERGYLKPGDWVVDCFAGVGLGAADALALGLNWFGNELEWNFVDMGGGCDCTGINKEDWVRCFGRWERFAHTDGRHWCPQCLAEAKKIVGPPLAMLPGMAVLSASYVRNSGKIPHTEPHHYTGNLDLFARHAKDGATAVLLQGDSRDLARVLAGARAAGIVASPPFLECNVNIGAVGDTSAKRQQIHNSEKRPASYGIDPANLGNMPAGDVDAVIASPPYATRTVHGGQSLTDLTGNPGPHSQAFTMADYGRTNGQLAALPEGEPPQAIALNTRGKKIKERVGVVYLLLTNPNDGITTLLEVGIAFDVLSFLGRTGVPVFTVNFDDEISFRQIEITEIPSDFELTGIDYISTIEEFSEPIFKLALPGLAIATERTIEAPVLFKAMRLYGKDTPADKALFFNATSSGIVSTIGRTKFGIVLEPGLNHLEFIATLLTNDNDTGNLLSGKRRRDTIRPRALIGTVATPLFCLTLPDGKDLATFYASDFNSISGPPGVGTFPGTAFIETLCDLARFCIEFASTDDTSPVGHTIGKAIPGLYLAALKRIETIAGTESIFITFPEMSPRPDEVLSALATVEQNGLHGHTMMSLQAPSIITPKVKKCKSKEPPAAIVSSPPWEQSIGNAAGTTDKKTVRKPVKNKEEIAEYLKRQRQKKGLSRREIDEYLGTCTLYSWYEGRPAGIEIPTPERWDKLKELLELDDRFDDLIYSQIEVEATSIKTVGKTGHINMADYGTTDGQLGQESGDTFWSAARAILLQCHHVLAPGGVAIWVVKDFVRNKKRVDFTGQWRALCEACGFETVEIVRAWLVEEKGIQYDLMGNIHAKTVERKSFFRRLYEFKARAARFWQSVTRTDKANYLWCAHSELWQDYRRRMAEKDELPPPLPTRRRILRAAQSMAYTEAGEPDIEIDTQIDYEVVLITRKV